MIRKLFYLTLIILLLYLAPTSWSNRLRDQTTHLLAPLATSLTSKNVEAHNFLLSINQIATLRQDKAALQQQVAELQQQVLQNDNTNKENEELRSELGVTGVTVPQKKVLARITLKSNDPFDPTFVVDVGSRSGVAIGQPAVYQGTLIGKVITVRQNSAIIRSVTSKESVVQAELADSHEEGKLFGDGKQLFISDITQGVSVKPGTIVETSGLGGSLPKGILIGEVASQVSEQSALSQQFLITPSQTADTISSLFILLIDTQ